ncbi:TIGR03086 family metal-binding protein [Mycobacterium sp. 236(2023)]|uniref:TIGR03086 family metal-binding protein n=1 Tax=Mycobacterium sp. 236(2023) TaxID=3038163 RepID=UPI0024153F6E|nr:TIGR03086 family metal-binding protein [Mycobacterium sp. 236(2023)]MDG4664125.1 TIGR03086 family metal-binding protein [Mycobacterium sp. 236(2023)]
MRTFKELHHTALQSSTDIVSTVRPDQLTLPTPCAGWRLADLLTHMTAQHHGFAAAARGHGADLGRWRTEPLADAVAADPAGAYAAAARDVLEAFAAPRVEDVAFALPEFGADVTVPGAMAMGFHFVDYVVHGWDVAASLGHPFSVPDDVAAAALPIALGVPDGEVRDAENSPFARATTPADTDDDFARILRHLGRNPEYR